MAAMMRTSTLTGCGLAERVDFALLEEAQQLGLEVEPDVADLVEEEGAAVGAADDAREGRVGAGEGAAAVAEQLALEHVARHRGAVERHERPAGAVRGAMDRAGEHLLAGAGFAGDEDRKVARRETTGEGDELDRLLGHPQALGVAFERLGRPQRRTLFLVAPVPIEGPGGGRPAS